MIENIIVGYLVSVSIVAGLIIILITLMESWEMEREHYGNYATIIFFVFIAAFLWPLFIIPSLINKEIF